VAREDAKIADMHMGMGEVQLRNGTRVGPPYGIVPGDGGVALIPLYMTPPLAKEYLMLAREFTAKELAQWGLINYAVPAGQLDQKVQEIVGRLLKRSAYALAWTKRIANRHVVEQINRTIDAGAAYEMVNFLQIEKMGWKDKKTLE
jgi:enoyl-CoA hydratase